MYVTEQAGIPTLLDILRSLQNPAETLGRLSKSFSFAPGIEKLADLEAGMRLPGIVTNVTAFGAFVDIGVHRDGLVHVSELSDSFVKDPRQVVQVHQKVTVTVLGVDLERGRVSLSMKSSSVLETSKPGNGDPPSEMVRHDKGPRAEKKAGSTILLKEPLKSPDCRVTPKEESYIFVSSTLRFCRVPAFLRVIHFLGP